MNHNESKRILAELRDAQDNGVAVVLATIVKTRGSTPRHAGAKMLIYEDGRISSTIGGGEMEARVVQEATATLRQERPFLVSYSLANPEQGDPGLCGGEVEVFLEPYLSPATVFIIGCGHVGQAVADLAHWLGYYVVVNDDRAELVTPEHTPHADAYLPGSLANVLSTHPITPRTYVVVVTRSAVIDRQILPQLLQTPAPYIGVIGSKRRWAETTKLLVADGLAEAQWGRIHAPIGLELNAETPAEIALSIMAEITMLRRGGSGKQMSE